MGCTDIQSLLPLPVKMGRTDVQSLLPLPVAVAVRGQGFLRCVPEKFEISETMNFDELVCSYLSGFLLG